MKQTIITIILAFIVSASIAQVHIVIDPEWAIKHKVDTIWQTKLLTNITFAPNSNSPVLTWETGSVKGGITPVDTTYEMYGDKPLRRISYKYKTKDNKAMEVVKTDTYNGKDWDFYSIIIHPLNKYSIIGNVGNAKLVGY